jgi:hypothetical protein
MTQKIQKNSHALRLPFFTVRPCPFTFVFLGCIIAFNLQAQNNEAEVQTRPLRTGYFNAGYGMQSFKSAGTDFLSMESDKAFSLEWGKTFTRTKPSFLNVGLDWTFLSLNVADYSKSFASRYAPESSKLYQLEAGMQIGPSLLLNVSPAGKELPAISVYLHYAPCFSGFYNEDYKSYAYRYAGFWSTGATVTFNAFGAGFEWRRGKAPYTFNTVDAYGAGETREHTWTTTGSYVYLSFRY